MFERTIPEIAKELGISKKEVEEALHSGIKKFKDFIHNDPSITHSFAGEVRDKEITAAFKLLPWCKFVRLWDGTVIPRNKWLTYVKKQEETHQKYKVT